MALSRVATVTISIAAVGAVTGAVLGGGLLGTWAAVVGVRGAALLQGAGFGAFVGASLGSFLAPVTAWAFLRRVPLGRALAQTAIGTTLGAALGLAAGAVGVASVASLPLGFVGALVGFLASAARLRFSTRAVARGDKANALGPGPKR